MSFVVFSLPRSRSAWMSHFLSANGREVGHDIGIDCATPGDFLFEASLGGTCETGADFAWPLIRKLRPAIKFAVVQRPIDDVVASLARFGIGDLDEELATRAARLDEISALPGTLTVAYHELAHFTACRDIFEFCTGTRCESAWWRRFDEVNIQVDMVKRMAKLERNRPRIEALKASAMELLDA